MHLHDVAFPTERTDDTCMPRTLLEQSSGKNFFATVYMRLLICFCVATAIVSVLSVCLHGSLKSVFRAECITKTGAPSASIAGSIVAAFLAASAVAFCSNFVIFFKSKSERARALLGALFSKWQPLYFIAVSAQKIISRSITVRSAENRRQVRVDECLLQSETQLHSAVIIWDCTILFIGLSAISSDLNLRFTPTMRRIAYGVLVTCLAVDAVSSFIWGNTMADQTSVIVGSFNLLLDDQITSTIISQTVIALHFLFVSCRSRRGRGWAYAPLRFELDDCGKRLLSKSNTPLAPQRCDEHVTHPSLTSELPESSFTNTPSPSSCISALRQKLSLFQEKNSARCRAFVIPCVCMQIGGKGTRSDFAMARPAFNMSLLYPLQRLADAHPKIYVFFVFLFLVVPNLACQVLLNGASQGITILILNLCMAAALFGFISSRFNGLDMTAVRHVVSSFRFAACVVLLAMWSLLSIRRAHQGFGHPTGSAALIVLTVVFMGQTLLDCSPHLSPSVQIVVSVILF